MSEEKKILVSARVSEAQANELDKIASENGMNRSDVISAKLSDNFTNASIRSKSKTISLNTVICRKSMRLMQKCRQS